MLLIEQEPSDGNDTPYNGFEYNFVESWEGWDTMDTMAFYFYDPILKIDIKDIKAGTKIEGFFVDYSQQILSFDITEERSITYSFKPSTISLTESK